MSYQAAFSGRVGESCTNLNFYGPTQPQRPARVSLLFDGVMIEGRVMGPYQIRLAGMGLRQEEMQTWIPPMTEELLSWHRNAQGMENGCIPQFLDWLIENAPDGLRRAIEKIVAQGVEVMPTTTEGEKAHADA